MAEERVTRLSTRDHLSQRGCYSHCLRAACPDPRGCKRSLSLSSVWSPGIGVWGCRGAGRPGYRFRSPTVLGTVPAESRDQRLGEGSTVPPRPAGRKERTTGWDGQATQKGAIHSKGSRRLTVTKIGSWLGGDRMRVAPERHRHKDPHPGPGALPGS